MRIDLYSETALSDSLFVLDDRKASHRVIRELKSSTWPRQNPAVDDFTPEMANKAAADSLFVVGRNLYQAACGGSRSASAYLADFASRTNGINEPKRKAILDGMLFEVFFDPNARLRKTFKLRKLEPLFSLQRHKDLLPSFDFIAECLLPDVAQFHALPGKRHEIAVDVVTYPAAKADQHVVESMHCGGESILWLEDEDYAPEPGEPPLLEQLTLRAFEAQLSEQMVLPSHLLKVNYLSFEKQGRERLWFPLGYTARKR